MWLVDSLKANGSHTHLTRIGKLANAASSPIDVSPPVGHLHWLPEEHTSSLQAIFVPLSLVELLRCAWDSTWVLRLYALLTPSVPVLTENIWKHLGTFSEAHTPACCVLELALVRQRLDMFLAQFKSPEQLGEWVADIVTLPSLCFLPQADSAEHAKPYRKYRIDMV